MGVWIQDGDTKVWTLTGDGIRTAVTSNDPAPTDMAMKLQIGDVADGIGAIVRSSADGRTCFQIDTVGANLILHRIIHGKDIAPIVTVPHEIAALTPYTMEVRLIQGVITVYIDDVPKMTDDVAGEFAELSRWGFEATTNGAQVQRAELCELVPNIDQRRDVLVVVAGGEVWASVDGQTISQITAGAMRSSGRVSIAEFNQMAYLVDGSNARRFDPVKLLVDQWVPTSGTLPGQTSDGTTTATIVQAHRGRLFLAGSENDPQNLWATAIEDALDLDTSAETRGRAFVLGGAGGSQATKVGQPITALQVLHGSSLGIGCIGQTWQLLGDPALGAIETIPISLDFGISDAEAMALVSEGLVVAHSPEGLLAVSSSGAVNLSQSLLTETIQFNRDEREKYRVTVVRDPQRHGTHVFISLATSGASTHFWYDERVGSFSVGSDGRPSGGLFPEEYPIDFGPLAAVYWRGRVVMGGRDGYIREFDDAILDDDGTLVDAYCAVEILDDPDTQGDTALGKTKLLLTSDSSPVDWTVYGGVTPEAAHDANLRWRLTGPRQVAYNTPPIWDRVRAPAMVMQLRNATLGQAFRIERVEAYTRRMKTASRQGKPIAPVISDPCPRPGLPGESGGTSTPSSSLASTLDTGPSNTSSTESFVASSVTTFPGATTPSPLTGSGGTIIRKTTGAAAQDTGLSKKAPR